MKRLYNYLTIAVMLMTTAFSMTSCDDDDADQAYDMNGIWQGTIQGNYYEDRYHSNGYDTEIQFVQEGVFSHGGYGMEIDYPHDPHLPISQVMFDWTVRDGRIYLDYEDGYRVIIRDYELYSAGRSTHFRGYFDDYHTGGQLASFDLIKISDETDLSYAKKHRADFSAVEADDVAEK